MKKKAAKFPIKRTIVERGIEKTYSMHENTTVHCVLCSCEFLINRDTAYIVQGDIDDMPRVRCPWCGKIAGIVDYMF